MIKRQLIMAAAALAVGTAVAGAQERPGPPAPGARMLPAHEIITILRSTGFDPVGRPVRTGSRYEVQAIDPGDYDVRLVVDGRTGRILNVRDSDDLGPMEPPFQHEGFSRTAGRFGPLSYGPLRPGGLVPPRSIPTPRSTATVEPQRAPVPRPRPEARREPAAASIAPNAPVGTSNSPNASHAGSPTNAPPPATVPSANIGVKDTVGATSGKNEKAANTAANTPPPGGPPAPDATSAARASDNAKAVPVVPLE